MSRVLAFAYGVVSYLIFLKNIGSKSQCSCRSRKRGNGLLITAPGQFWFHSGNLRQRKIKGSLR